MAALLPLSPRAHAVDPPIPVVLSTDVGNEIDDQWTISHLLLQPRIHVLGILSAHAPSLAAPAAHTSFRILVDIVENRLGMGTHPPLLEGASLPLTGTSTPQPSAAARFLIETSKPFAKDHRLDVLVIGAPTDIASAILSEPSIIDRIRVVQMAFIDERGGDEYNVLNDPRAEQVILDSGVPLVIGPASTCRADLPMTYTHARDLLATRGPIGAWLWDEFQAWYFRVVKPLRQDDLSRPWYIWDDITLAYLLGFTEQHTAPRPHMRADATFDRLDPNRTVTWITRVDSSRLWADFARVIDTYQLTHRLAHSKTGEEIASPPM